jgi:hypothetical protein
MAIFKLFPIKDATIYSWNAELNSGLSEILDLSNGYIDGTDILTANRVLIKFSEKEINNIINNYVGTSSFSSSLKLYLADASSIPSSFKINAAAISGSWDMGTGRADNQPAVTNGVNWINRKVNQSWLASGYGLGVTGSFLTSSIGGGNWYTASMATQSFYDRANLDINFDVTPIVRSFVSNSIMNEGFIIKNDPSIEFNGDYSYKLTYFSVDTNTIYPPCLEIKWDDSEFTPNTGSMSIIGPSSVITLANNRGEYKQGSIVRFDINARDQYPARVFSTSSLYTVNKYLPSSSYYSIRDLDTDNIVVDFDKQFTKISTDSNGSYFNLYMDGLEPERYYMIEIRIIYNGTNNVYNYSDNFYFKVSK